MKGATSGRKGREKKHASVNQLVHRYLGVCVVTLVGSRRGRRQRKRSLAVVSILRHYLLVSTKRHQVWEMQAMHFLMLPAVQNSLTAMVMASAKDESARDS